jgi:predicted CoA-binding protein
MTAAGEGPPPADDALLREILSTMRRIAVVGISDRPDRASHGIARFLIGHGFEVVPVNPRLDEVFGLKVHPDLRSVDGHIDVVDVFRRSEAVPPIIDEAIAVRADTVWLQQGIRHDEAASRALAAGLRVVQDRCIYQEWLRLMNG